MTPRPAQNSPSGEPGEALASGAPWPSASAARRWYGLGRYYAMFPMAFVHTAIEGLTRPGERVLDPFCGRGNAPYAAALMGRPSLAVDINPIAWLYTATKLDPEASVERLLARLRAVGRAARSDDRAAESEFEEMAWCPDVRALLKSARRELDWRGNVTDRTLMAFVTMHMQSKLGDGLSNALWETVSCAPQYAVRWWTARGMVLAPEIDPQAMLTEKILRRYTHGTPDCARSEALLGEAAERLRRRPPLGAALMLTSPPYRGVTDYWNDQWIRLWVLGEPLRQNWSGQAKLSDRADYHRLIADVFAQARRHLRDDATVLVRSDRRQQTAGVCRDALLQLWPRHAMYLRGSDAPSAGSTRAHGTRSKAREVDFLLTDGTRAKWALDNDFSEYDERRWSLQ